ncbi:YtxH domain-containing protein [Nonomuraea sp. NPDC050022]|uniref:YtxH domain-containing protein n=1 Tax=Nonomuraea sp. NPDC050022 TaxID=3364358 RepID=UPI00378D0B90
MSLTLKNRRVVIVVPTTWMGRMKARAMRTGRQMTPMADQAKVMADQAKVVAAHRIEDARYWAAPRLEEAAHRVEDELAPKVSAMLINAAERIDPTPRRSRGMPVMILLTGIAVGALGYLFYRRNARQWTEHMKDSASDASQWAGDKADKTADATERMASEMSDKADEASRKMT